MTQKTVLSCDRCYAEINDARGGMTMHVVLEAGRVVLVAVFPVDSVKHFCAKCTREFHQFLTHGIPELANE